MSTTTTEIAWTDRTWGPTRGCSRVSAGCESCYAERQAYRFSTKPGSPYESLVRLGKKGPVWTGKVRLVPGALAEPLSWRKPARVFVDSMSDLFHDGLKDEEIDRVFAVMLLAPRHTFQVLTKRAARMRRYFERDDLYTRILYEADAIRRERPELTGVGISDPRTFPASWIWLGVSVEDQPRADERVPQLLATPAAVRFVSYEPALEGVRFAPYLPPELGTCSRDGSPCTHSLAHDRAALDWIIVGGESGPRARPFDIGWAQSVVAEGAKTGTPIFVKQLGRIVRRTIPGSAFNEDAVGTVIDATLKDRKGGDMLEWPADLCVRQFPEVRS